MKTTKYWILAAILAVCVTVLVSGSLWGVSHEKEREYLQKVREYLQRERRGNLAGLKGVYVSVIMDVAEEQRQTIEKHGLTEEGLKTFAELELRRSGIKVLSGEDWFDTPWRPWLAVTAWVSKLEAEGISLGLAAMYLTVELIEDATLKRNPDRRVDGVTWQETRRGFALSRELKQKTENTIEDILRKFCNDYLAANPKEESVKQAQETAHTNVTATSRGELWVKCNSPDCAAAYRISEQDYYQQIEERVKANPMALVTPALTCKRCGKESVYRAVKCEKCGHMFFYGNPNDFNDRCPKCGYSKMENERKKRTQGLPSTP